MSSNIVYGVATSANAARAYKTKLRHHTHSQLFNFELRTGGVGTCQRPLPLRLNNVYKKVQAGYGLERPAPLLDTRSSIPLTNTTMLLLEEIADVGSGSDPNNISNEQRVESVTNDI